MIVNIITHATFGSSYEKGRRVFEHRLALVNLTIHKQKFGAIP
jgi:hypothetical protein